MRKRASRSFSQASAGANGNCRSPSKRIMETSFRKKERNAMIGLMQQGRADYCTKPAPFGIRRSDPRVGLARPPAMPDNGEQDVAIPGRLLHVVHAFHKSHS